MSFHEYWRVPSSRDIQRRYHNYVVGWNDYDIRFQRITALEKYRPRGVHRSVFPRYSTNFYVPRVFELSPQITMARIRR